MTVPEFAISKIIVEAIVKMGEVKNARG